MKNCSKCKDTKELAEFPFQNKKEGKHMPHCRDCNSARQKEERLKNIEKIREKDKKRYEQEKKHRVDYAREYRKKRKDKTRDTHLYTKYRIRQNDYLELKEKQNDRCAICGEHESELKRILCVDHTHETGLVRGLLCDTCNKFLGFYEKYHKECERYLRENDR